MFDFERLEVYLKAYEVHRKIYRLIKKNPSIVSYIKNQLGNASLTAVLCIAEGSARFDKRTKKSFYIKGRSAAFVCVSLINFLHEEGEISDEVKKELYDSYESVSRMLFTMINHLAGRREWKEL
jgi:four helix bundle protein